MMWAAPQRIDDGDERSQKSHIAFHCAWHAQNLFLHKSPNNHIMSHSEGPDHNSFCIHVSSSVLDYTTNLASFINSTLV